MGSQIRRWRRRCWTASCGVALITLTGPTSLNANTPSYGNVDQATLDLAVAAFRDDPTYLVNNIPLLRALTPEQLAKAIERLDLSHYAYLHPVVVKGEDVPDLIGRQVNEVSVMVVRGERMMPIPFQIDELDHKGWVWLPDVSPNDLAGTYEQIDEDDELVFMYRDTGYEPYDAGRHGEVQGEILRELVFEHQGKARYAYLVEGDERRNSADYVSFDAETGISDNTYYWFRTDPSNFLDFQDFRAKVGPRQDKRVLDAIYAELETGVFTRWPKLRFNTLNNIRPELIFVNDGPVRATGLLKMRIIAAGIPVFNILTQVTIYDQGLVLPVSIHIPGGEILTRVLNEPRFVLALDFNDIQGGHVNAAGSRNPDGYAIVDGEMSELERTATISHEKNWLWMDSQLGWDIFARFDIPPGWPEDLRLLYQDDPKATTEWEDFPGAAPRIGVDARGFPVGKLDISLTASLWFPDTVGAAGPKRFGEESLSPPRWEARDYSSQLAKAD